MRPFQPPLPSEISGNLLALEEKMRQKIFAATKTPLQNFEAFEALWPQLVAQNSVHLLFVEMDEMKRLNNEFGHDSADQFLLKLGEILRALCSEQIYAFHMSGDEFLVVTCNLANARVEDLASRIVLNAQRSQVLLSGKEEKFTVSVGITEVDRREENRVARDLAELAVKKAKSQGRNQHVWFMPEMEKQKPHIDVRKDCPKCQTHFSFSIDEEIYRNKENFSCPVCGEAVAR